MRVYESTITTAVIITIPATSTQNPALYISTTRILLLPKTIVLGAVATGSINPSEAARVAGINNMSGSTQAVCTTQLKLATSIEYLQRSMQIR
jgi:hypothetical protein